MAAEFASHLTESTAAAPAGERQAALALHGMAAVDRDWMLQQLSPDRRAVMEVLLAELRELGVAAPQPLLPAVVEATAAPVREPTAVAPLQSLSSDALYQLLRDEPDGLVSDVLGGLGPFEHEAGLLQRLRAGGRAVEPLLQSPGPLPSRRAEALSSALLRRAAALPAPPTEPSTAPAGVRWFQRLVRRVGDR